MMAKIFTAAAFLMLLAACPIVAASAEDAVYLDAGALKRGLERGSMIAVDTRPANLFAQSHIPDSLNISPFTVKTKDFFRGRPLILIDHPLSLCLLLALRQELLNAGYARFGILKGGIAAWYSEAAADGMTAVNKHTLAGTLKYRDLKPIVIDIRSMRKFLARHLESAHHIPWRHTTGHNRGEASSDELGRSLQVIQ